MSGTGILLIFIIVTIAMFVVFSIVYDFWGYAIIVYFITLVVTMIAYVAKTEGDKPAPMQRPARGRRTVYSSKMDVGNDRGKIQEEKILRKKIEEAFDNNTLFRDAEDFR